MSTTARTRHSLPVLLVGIGLGFLPPAQASDRLRAAPRGTLVEAPDGASRAELLTFDRELARELLAVPLESQVRVADWPVAPGLRRTLVVTRHEVYAPDARLVAIDRGREVEVPRSRLVFFWGGIEGDPESTAMIAVDPDDATFSGFATGSGGSFDLLPPAAERPGRHLVASSAALRPRGGDPSFACGQSELPQGGEREGPAPGVPEPNLPSSVHTAVLAFDTDNEAMGTKFSNNTTTAANWMAAAVAGMSAVYERDVFIRFYQGYTIFRLSTTLDPYVQNAGGNADGDKLNEFSSYWGANYAGVRRTLSLMISGKQPSGGWSGIAWIGGLCSNSVGYSFNQVFRTGTSVGGSDIQLLTHEVGHNFGSRHTHCTDTNPGATGTQPIDYCYSGETCTATGPWTPNPGVSCPVPFSITPLNGGGTPINNVRGTLMSYCHNLSGCGVTNVFHPSTVNVLSPRIDTAVGTCIFPLNANPAPAVAAIAPGGGTTAGGTPVTLTGTGFRSPASVVFADLARAASATSIVVVNSTTITAVTPAHVAGLTDVVVMNPDHRTGTLRLAYNYSSAPTIASINPNSGLTTGGTPVTITGTNFSAPATVTIGGAAATGVNVASATTITATTPAHAAGIVDVGVVTGGTTLTLPSGYQYVAPPSASAYFTLAPCRLVDTRNPTGPRGGPAIGPSARRNFTLTGVCGIPAGAKSLSVNLTVASPAAAGNLKLFPGNGIAPVASHLNFSAGQTRGNNAIVLLATDGTGVLAVQNGSTGSLHFVLDVNGYFQ